jgi:hypothetical protein
MNTALTSRPVWCVLACVATLTFATPLLLLLVAQGDHLPFAHESLTFRYFTNVRILNGEGGDIWLPQGQLLTTLQHVIVTLLQIGAGLSAFDLKPMLHWYALLTNTAMAALYGAVALAAVFDRRLTWFDRAIVMLIGPFVVLATGSAGFYYTLLPDYWSFNVVIVTASAYLTIALLRDPRPFRWADIILAGLLWGVAATNKVTLLGPTGLVVIMAATKSPCTLRLFVFRSATAVLLAFAAFLGVFLACYLFRIGDMVAALQSWSAFFAEAGAEPAFWEGNFPVFLKAYHYDAIAYLWVAGTVVLAIEICHHRSWRSRLTALWFASLAVAILLGLGLLKRGAGTTLFEVATIATGLVAVQLAATLGNRPSPIGGAIVIATGIVFATIQFDRPHNWFVVSRSAELAGRSWELHEYALSLAGHHRPIVMLMPDASYGWSGIEELIGMGLSDNRAGKLGGAIAARSPLHPVEFFFLCCVKFETGAG